jgi:hypothetical protein
MNWPGIHVTILLASYLRPRPCQVLSGKGQQSARSDLGIAKPRRLQDRLKNRYLGVGRWRARPSPGAPNVLNLHLLSTVPASKVDR